MAKKFLSDEDMASLEVSQPKVEQAKKRFLSDEDMGKHEAQQTEALEGPTLKGAGDAVLEGAKDAPKLVAKGLDPYDVVTTAAEHSSDWIPGKGLLTRVGALPAAAVEYGYDHLVDDGKKSFSDAYDNQLAAIKGEQAKQREQSYLGGKIGDATGVAGTATIPAAKNPLARIAVNTGVGAVENATAGDKVFDTEAAKKGGKDAALISGAIESIPYVGKAAGWAGKNIVNKAGLGVGVGAQERYLENPEGVRTAIKEGEDALGNIKTQVDEAYHAKVTAPREEAAVNLADAKAAKKEAARETKDYMANLKNLKPDDSLTNDVIQSVRKENAELTSLSTKAYDTLDGTEFNRGGILGKIEEIKNGLLVDGKKPTLGDSAPAWGVLERLEKAVQSGESPELNSLMNQAQEIPGLAGRDLKRLIQQLDQESTAAYTTYGTRGAAKHIKGVRDELDPILKIDPITKTSTAYADAMVPTAEQAGLVSKLTKTFGTPEKARSAILMSADPEKGKNVRLLLKKLDDRNGSDFLKQLDEYHNAQKILRDPEAKIAAERVLMSPSERGLEAAQATAKEASEARKQFSRVGPGGSENTIKSVGRKKNLEGEKQLQALVGDDALESIKDYGAAQSFVGDKTNGSRRTLLGAVVGSTLNFIPGGAVVGAASGAALDTLGGTIARKLLDGSLVVGPYQAALERAAKSGRASLAAMHLYLMKNKPDYRESVEKSNNGVE